jgi:hypothetical protein
VTDGHTPSLLPHSQLHNIEAADHADWLAGTNDHDVMYMLMHHVRGDQRKFCVQSTLDDVPGHQFPHVQNWLWPVLDPGGYRAGFDCRGQDWHQHQVTAADDSNDLPVLNDRHGTHSMPHEVLLNLVDVRLWRS